MHMPIRVRLVAPTPGTRIAVWLFPVITAYLGIAYLGPPERLQSPSYTAAESVPVAWFGHMTMHAWGFVFLALALFKVACIIRGTIRGLVVAMCAGMGLYAMWAFLFAVSIFVDPHAALAGPGLPLGWVGMHVAFLATMTERGR